MDPGLAPERTALAWQRTALSILFGSLLLARLTVGRVGMIAILTVAISVPMAFWVYAESRRRYQGDPLDVTSGGRTTFALTFITVLGGSCELVALLAEW